MTQTWAVLGKLLAKNVIDVIQELQVLYVSLCKPVLRSGVAL